MQLMKWTAFDVYPGFGDGGLEDEAPTFATPETHRAQLAGYSSIGATRISTCRSSFGTKS